MSEVLLFDPNNQTVEPISLTPRAALRVKDTINQRGSGKGIRLVVKKTGCSGYTYIVEILDEEQTDDYIFPIEDGLFVAVSQTFFDLVKGTCIDYVHEGLNSGFRFTNPNQKGVCGCGESFTI